jgi:hypothetical protein
VAVSSLPLALAADPVKVSSCLHARSRLDLVLELVVEVARLRAQEVPVTNPVNSLQHPFLFSESAVVAIELGSGSRCPMDPHLCKVLNG